MASESFGARRRVTKTYEGGLKVDDVLRTFDAGSMPAALESLRAQMLAARRSGRALSIALFSVEYLRSDPLGDAARRQVRKFLRIVAGNLRHTDSCGLLGEAEILAILPDADEEGCRAATARLLSTDYRDSIRALRLGVSFAVLEQEADDCVPTDLVDRARRRLRRLNFDLDGASSMGPAEAALTL